MAEPLRVSTTDSPPWSGKKLAKLGDALVSGAPTPADCPDYSAVMDWHSELCAEVGGIILEQPWTTLPRDTFDVTARAKTIDTLRDKLIRQSWMRLNQVQDLAGVRVDADCTLRQQTHFAEEVANHFGANPNRDIHDLRQDPHSGYRAVHVWLRLPAGRVEVQIRTRGQSAWANAYEQLGDYAGRHIRYEERHENPEVQAIVEYLHRVSSDLARLEDTVDECERACEELMDIMASVSANLGVEVLDLTTPEAIAGVVLPPEITRDEFTDQIRRSFEVYTRMAEIRDAITHEINTLADHMEAFQRTLDGQTLPQPEER